MKFIMTEEDFINQSHKLFTNTSFYVHTLKRGEANHLSLSISLFWLAW